MSAPFNAGRHWGIGLGLWVRHFGLPQMDRLFDKKPKKSLKSSQRRASPGVPTNIAADPLGFRAGPNVDPKGEQRRSYYDWEELTWPRRQMRRAPGHRRSCLMTRRAKIKGFPERQNPLPLAL